MNKHTPGPWFWDDKVWDYDPEQQAPWLINSNDDRILSGQITCLNEADARLIAAAPDLLKALEGTIDWLDDGNRILSDSCAADVAKARAAIKAARGEA